MRTRCTRRSGHTLDVRIHRITARQHHVPRDCVVTVRAQGHSTLSARVKQPIDQPTWNPTPARRPGRAADVAAFAAMRATLDAHEQEHRRIGEANRVVAQDNFRALDVSATGSTRAEAMRNLAAAIRADKNSGAPTPRPRRTRSIHSAAPPSSVRRMMNRGDAPIAGEIEKRRLLQKRRWLSTCCVRQGPPSVSGSRPRSEGGVRSDRQPATPQPAGTGVRPLARTPTAAQVFHDGLGGRPVRLGHC